MNMDFSSASFQCKLKSTKRHNTGATCHAACCGAAWRRFVDFSVREVGNLALTFVSVFNFEKQVFITTDIYLLLWNKLSDGKYFFVFLMNALLILIINWDPFLITKIYVYKNWFLHKMLCLLKFQMISK